MSAAAEDSGKKRKKEKKDKKEKKKKGKKGDAAAAAEQPAAAAGEPEPAAAPAKKRKTGADGAAAEGQQQNGDAQQGGDAQQPAGQQQQQPAKSGGTTDGNASDGGYISSGREGTAARAFQRVKADEWLNQKGSWDNSYEGTFGRNGWGWKAQEVLGKVRRLGGTGDWAAQGAVCCGVGRRASLACIASLHRRHGRLPCRLCFARALVRRRSCQGAMQAGGKGRTCMPWCATHAHLPPHRRAAPVARVRRCGARTSGTRRRRRSGAATRAGRSTLTPAAPTSLSRTTSRCPADAEWTMSRPGASGARAERMAPSRQPAAKAGFEALTAPAFKTWRHGAAVRAVRALALCAFIAAAPCPPLHPPVTLPPCKSQRRVATWHAWLCSMLVLNLHLPSFPISRQGRAEHLG